MKPVKCFITIAFLLATVISPSIGVTIRPDHPRLHITQETLPYLREKIKNYYLSEYQRFVSWVDADFDKDEVWYAGLMADYFAFIYLLGPIEGVSYQHNLSEYKQRAIEIMLTTASSDLENPGGVGSEKYHNSHVSMARAYDWLYNKLTQEQREKIANWLAKAGLLDLDCARRYEGISLFSSHYFGRVQPWYIGLAFHGDGINDSVAQELVDSFEELMLNGKWLDAQNWVARYKGGVSEIGHYGLFHPGAHIIQIDAWRTATGENYFSKGTNIADAYFVRYYPLYILYRLKPAEPKLVLKWGEIDSGTKVHGRLLRMLVEPLKSVDTNMAALDRWIIENLNMDNEEFAFRNMFQIILGDRSIPAKSPGELGLPLTQYFEGIGMVIMRTGFDDLNDTVIAVGAPKYLLGGHSWFGYSQIPMGFTIDKYGPLVIKRAGYARGAEHRQNIIRFTDPSTELNGGFARGMNPPHNIQDYTTDSPWYKGGVTKLETYSETGEYDYIYMDLTRDYLPDRVSNYTRQFVYLRPQANTYSDYIVIFDRTQTTRPDIIKRWEINMAYNPEINGQETQIREGKWEYTGADQIIITNDIDPDPYSGKSHPEAHGKLFIKTLLPQNVKIVKVGGPGHEFENDAGENKGVNADYYHLREDGALFVGTYFVDVIPTENDTQEDFLHVLQTADANTTDGMVQTERIDGDTMVGAHIASSPGQSEWVVMFSKTEENQTQVNYSVTAWSPEIKHLIADLEPNRTYNIYQNGEKIYTMTSSNAGTIHFISTGGGSFSITQGNQPPQPPLGKPGKPRHVDD